MDSIKNHWSEWGFPGHEVVHLHSTPLQLTFERGIPMLVLWIWLVVSFWIYLWRAQREASDRGDTNTFGVLIGILGALTGLLLSSFVNYNFGDSEVVMLFWFLMGMGMSGIEFSRSNLATLSKEGHTQS